MTAAGERPQESASPGLWRSGRWIVGTLLPFARDSRRWFGWGCLVALGVVAARLALPWPLRAIADRWNHADAPSASADPVVQVFALGTVFLVLIGSLGLFDSLERLYFARFSHGLVRAVRAAAFWKAMGAAPPERPESERAADGADIDDEDQFADGAMRGSGDLIARLIGDTARVKEGLQAFLVHVATNGALVLGITSVLFALDYRLGLIFAAAGLGTGLVTALAAERIFHRAVKQREREGRLAEQIREASRREPGDARYLRIDKSSAQHESALTRVLGSTTFIAHLFFGLAVLGALWVAAQGAASGRVATGDILVMMMYALIMRGPIVRLARQGAKTGKILGAAARLAQILGDASTMPAPVRLLPLRDRLRLSGLVVMGSAAAPLDLEFKAGERIALIDEDGSGASALLETIAGFRAPAAGGIAWDGHDLLAVPRDKRRSHILHVPRQALPADDSAAVEARLTEFLRLLHCPASLWLLDDPTGGLPEPSAKALLKSLLRSKGRATLVLVVGATTELERFDRVLVLRFGRIAFDGAPSAWKTVATAAGAAPSAAPPARLTARKDSPVIGSTALKILFTGYAPVHFICFQPLFERLARRPGVEITLSGGVRSRTAEGWVYDTEAMYRPFALPAHRLLPVPAIRERDFDIVFAGNTKMILPRSVKTRIQIFHGLSFRNKAVRPENSTWDYYFVVGPYMRRRFAESGLLPEGDPRAVPIGFMKTDRLIDGSLARKALLAEFGLGGERPILLYAPTGALHNSLEIMGEAVIERLIAADRYDLLVKPHDHPKNASIDWFQRLARFEGEHCRVMREPDVIKLLYLADLLITDASSVANEFTLLDRPIVFLDTPELIEQALAAKDSMVDLDTWGRKGGLVARGPDEIDTMIDHSLRHPAALSGVRRAMANDFFFNPGRATDAAMAWLERHVLAGAAVADAAE